MDMIPPPAFEKRALRDVLGAFTTGVTVITTCDRQGKPYGLTANSFSSVSLDPPLVLWSQSLGSSSYGAFHESEVFAVNILADDQIALSNAFARSGVDKFAGVDFLRGIEEVPVLCGTSAHLQCRKIAEYPGGDHVVYLGRVERIGMTGRRPLAFSHGKYMVPYAHELGPVSLTLSGTSPVPPSALRIALDMLPDITRQVGDHTIALGVWGNHGPTIVHWEPSAQPVSDRIPTGLVVSCTRTATGLCFSSFLPAATTRSFVAEDLRQWRAADEDVETQRAHFDMRIGQIQQDGFVQVIDDAPSVLHQVNTTAVAVPVRGPDEDVLMSLCLVTHSARADTCRSPTLPDALLRAAAELSARLVNEL